MNLATWKIMLPLLRKQMQKTAPDKTPLLYALFSVENGKEDISTVLEFLSGDRYKGLLDKENTFYDIMLKNSAAIKGDWHTVTLLIDFENRAATTTTFDQNKKPINTTKY